MPDAVRVRARRRADDDDRPADLRGSAKSSISSSVMYSIVKALVAQRRVVDRLRCLAEHHEVRVAVGQLLVVHDLRVLEAHLRRQLLRRLARRQAVGHGQREAELHDPVAEVVGVGLDPREVDLPRGARGDVCRVRSVDPLAPCSGKARRSAHQLARRVQVALVDLDDALRAAALVDLARHVAEDALAERREQADARRSARAARALRRAPPARASGRSRPA